MTHSISKDLLTQLTEIVGAANTVAGAELDDGYLREWRGLYTGSAALLLKPANTAEVSGILKLCNDARIAVVPQGGNSGLAGGAIPGLGERPEVLLSLERMNRIRELDAANFTVTAEAGVILADLQKAAADSGRLFPLSLAAEGSCQIGGNVSTNAGGTNVLRYGNTRDLVLGIEAVLPDGRIYSGLNAVRKDNTGYDLKQLFVGAEGTLGVVTAVVCKLFPEPVSQATALLAAASPEAVVALFESARGSLGDEITAFEMFPDGAMTMVTSHLPGCSNPFDGGYPWYVLLETSAQYPQAELDQRVTGFLEQCLEEELLLDGVVAQSGAQRDELWALRHGISEAQKHDGASIKHDVSVPVSKMPEFIGEASAAAEKIVPGVRPVPFGHLGDGNIHFNLSQPQTMQAQEFLDLWPEVNEVVHSIAVAAGGSFSAEHGIGYLKKDELARLADPVKLELMRSVKAALDPNGIMNPGKLL